MSNKNLLGANPYINENIRCSLENLNDSVLMIIKKNKEFSFIKKVDFYFEEDTRLMCSIHLRSGDVIEKEFPSNFKEEVCLCGFEIQAFFGEEKYRNIEKYLEDNKLSEDYLRAYEKDLLKQLVMRKRLEQTPNTLEGANFSEDHAHFLKLCS